MYTLFCLRCGHFYKAQGCDVFERVCPECEMPLHDAIEIILTESDDAGLTANEIADENKRRKLYAKRNNAFPDASQIHARVNKYPELFRKKEVADGNQLIYLND